MASPRLDMVFAVRLNGRVVKTVSVAEGMKLIKAAMSYADGDEDQAEKDMLKALQGIARRV